MGRSRNTNRYMAAGVSEEMLELTIHYVSFLKSMAMRMNPKTMSFFLAYDQGDREVKFLLYACFL